MLVSEIVVYAGSHGNIFNCVAFLKRFCSRVRLVTKAEELLEVENSAHILVIPGVSNTGVLSSKEFDLLSAYIKTRLIPSGGKLVGICAGFQLFGKFVVSENGERAGLGLIDMPCIKLPLKRAPHFGWYPIKDGILAANISNEDKFYFAHAYGFVRDKKNLDHTTTIATADGVDFIATFLDSAVFGCQFHPELSSGSGENLMERVFREWNLNFECL